MKLIQRLGSALDDEYINDYLKLITNNKGSCDEVWFATLYGFPKLDTHKTYAKKIKEYAMLFRSEKIGVSLQLSNSIGHGQYMSARDCTGLIYEGSNVEKMVGPDGIAADYCFCFRGENFKKYLLRELEIYCTLKPETIWIDDDFRATNHAPVKYGCFCDNCIEKFNETYNTDFSREQLCEEILHGDIKYREYYVDFLRKGLGDLMYEMGKTIHKCSPDTNIGYQYGTYGAYTGYGFEYVFDAMKRATGKNPLSRPGGGCYNDHDPNAIIEKGLCISWANSMLPQYVSCKCPEIENLPFVAFGKSPAGTALETTYYLANGNTDMSYSMMMNMNEPVSYHEKEFKLFAKHRKYWEKLSLCSSISYQSGLRYYMSEYIWKKKLKNNEGFDELNTEKYYEAQAWLRDAIPVTLDKEENSVILLNAETAKVLSNSEIEMLMKKNVIADGESVKIIAEKGFDLGVKAYKIDKNDVLKISEKLSCHPVNPNYLKKWSSSFFTSGNNDCYYFAADSKKAEILGYYQFATTVPNYTQDKNYPYGIAELILTLPGKVKWAVLGYAPWKGVISYSKREQILNIADYIGQKKLPARIKTPVMALLMPRSDKTDGKTISVSIMNPTVGESGAVKLIIRNPKGDNFYFVSQNTEKIKLSYTKDGDDYILNIPSIMPWSMGSVFIEK